MGWVLEQLQTSVAAHRVGNVNEQCVRNGIARVLQQRVNDLFGVVAGGSSIPQSQWGDAVGVDVLRGTLEFGEGCNFVTALLRQGVIDIKQQGLVALHNQGSFGHAHTCSVVGSEPGSMTSTPAIRLMVNVRTSPPRWS